MRADDDIEIAAVVVPETISASQLEADVDIDELFEAGADLDDVPVMRSKNVVPQRRLRPLPPLRKA